MEPSEVTARIDAEGRVYPLKFSVAAQTYSVESIGRSWQDESSYHILVMSAGDRVFELIFSTAEMKWFVKQIGKGKAAV
jgi:hypothetical protein